MAKNNKILQNLDYNDVMYIIKEAKNRLLLNEISNNAVETLLKTYCPHLTQYFNLTLGEIYDNMSNGSEEFWTLIYGLSIETPEITKNRDMKLKDYLRLKIFSEFNAFRKGKAEKYIRGIIRIACGELNRFGPLKLKNSEQREKNYNFFQSMIEYICGLDIDIDENLNGYDYRTLCKVIGSRFKYEVNNKPKHNENGENIFGEYTVIPINGYEEASKYSQYTSWCVTQGSVHYNTYTKDGSQFYFCLKNGFEKVSKRKGEGCPLDEYGLSMVSVLIFPDNSVKHITTRWNHDNKGEDNPNLSSLEQVEQIMGIPKNIFVSPKRYQYDINDIDYLLQQPNVTLEYIYSIIQAHFSLGNNKNYDIIDMRDGSNIVVENILKKDEKKLIFNEWGDVFSFIKHEIFYFVSAYSSYCAVFSLPEERILCEFTSTSSPYRWGDYIVFKNDEQCNIIDINGNIKLPYDDIVEIKRESCGYIPVLNVVRNIDGMYFSNCYDEDLNMLGKKWLHNVTFSRIENNFIVVKDNHTNKFKIYSRKTGNMIFDFEFDKINLFCNGFAIVRHNGKSNYINTDGEIISDQWFDECYNLDRGGFFRVKIDDKYNYLNTDGEIISDQWFDMACMFNDDFAIVELNDKSNYLNADGEIISDQWFDVCYNFYRGFATVKLNGKWNYLNTEGKVISDIWFDNTYVFSDGLAAVVLDNKWNIINTEGKIISDIWFDWVGDIMDVLIKVKLDNKWNFINTDGEIMFDKWFDEVYDFNYGIAIVELNGKLNFVNANGKIMFDKWFDDAHDFNGDYVEVKLNDEWIRIDSDDIISH